MTKFTFDLELKEPKSDKFGKRVFIKQWNQKEHLMMFVSIEDFVSRLASVKYPLLKTTDSRFMFKNNVGDEKDLTNLVVKLGDCVNGVMVYEKTGVKYDDTNVSVDNVLNIIFEIDDELNELNYDGIIPSYPHGYFGI